MIYRVEERNKISNSTFVPFFHHFPSQESIVILLMLLLTYLRIHGISNARLTFSTSHDTKATIERRSINKDRLSYGRSFIFPLLESLFHPTKRIRNVTTRNVPIATSCGFVERRK